MQKFNNDMLISNISLLMKKKSITQSALAEEIGMSQPNFNRAINNTNGTRFTIEQIYDIAHYFGVTIDWLMGNQEQSSLTPKAAADFFTTAVSCGDAKLIKICVEELDFRNDEYAMKEEPEKVKSEYWALYFPTLKEIYTYDMNEDECMIASQNALRQGNETPYWIFNDYLDKLHSYTELKQTGKLGEDDFQTLVAKQLKKIEE
ncbi:MAG: helix-turn-helix transcriptional regulator [Clostridia bacterium]|nr:helix-turn-helix transcriptional regulator [Clostridia bacterium]